MDLSTIDLAVGAAIINLGTALSSLVLKGTGTAIHGKIASLKNETSTDTIRNMPADLLPKANKSIAL